MAFLNRSAVRLDFIIMLSANGPYNYYIIYRWKHLQYLISLVQVDMYIIAYSVVYMFIIIG